uniref:RNA2 polyprotein n=2 Tax=Bean pod mottle virus TaxID=12260 RepID=D5IC34_9SECO|nr:large polyprotein 2 [Bean pod mottle virus]
MFASLIFSGDNRLTEKTIFTCRDLDILVVYYTIATQFRKFLPHYIRWHLYTLLIYILPSFLTAEIKYKRNLSNIHISGLFYDGRYKFWTKHEKNLALTEEEKMEVIRNKGIPADVLAKRAHEFEKHVAHESLKDQIPAVDKLYSTKVNKFAKIMNLRQSVVGDLKLLTDGKLYEGKHIPVSNISAGENHVVQIPLMAQEEILSSSASDFRTAMVSKNSKPQATAMHVGAIEIIIDSFASPDCNIVGAMLLVDTYHTNPENAVRSIFVAPFRGGRPIRVVTFPNTIVQIEPDMNSRFQLLSTTTNGDFVQGKDLAMVKVNVACAAVGLTSSYTPTPLLESGLQKDRGLIVEYFGRMSYVAHNVNQPQEKDLLEGNFSFDIKSRSRLEKVSSTKAQFVSGKTFKYDIIGAGSHSSEDFPKKEDQEKPKKIDARLRQRIDPQYNEVQAQMETNLFKLSLDDVETPKGSMLDLKISQSKIALPKNTVGGTILRSDLLANFLTEGNFRASVDLQRTHRIKGMIKMVATVGIPENTGISLACAMNSSFRGRASSDIYTICSQDCELWNPACTKAMTMSFNPNPCSDAWSLEFLKRTGFPCDIICVTGWTATPMQDVQVTIDWFISSQECVPRTYCVLNPQNPFVLNRWMGKLTFPQGTSRSVKRMPLSIGGGAGAKNAILMNMPNAVLSMWRYFVGDLVFEVSKMTSPYIKCTVSFFIAFGNLADDTINFEAFPHKLVQFGEIQEKVVLKFSQEEFLTAWSTQVRPATTLLADGCPYLYAMVHDSSVSTIPGDFVIGVKLATINNMCAYGLNPGISGSRLLGTIPQSISQQTVWNQMATVRTPLNFDPSKQSFCQFSIDLLGGGILVDKTGDWITLIQNSPISNLLRVAAWKKGCLMVKIVMSGNAAVKRSDWASLVQVFLTNSNSTEHFDACKWTKSEPHSWELIFPIEVCGPNNGFEMWSSEWANQTSWHLSFLIDNPKQSTVFDILLGISQDFEIAGNTLMPAFSVPQATARSSENAESSV